jgi:hypothetical protein
MDCAETGIGGAVGLIVFLPQPDAKRKTDKTKAKHTFKPILLFLLAMTPTPKNNRLEKQRRNMHYSLI